VEVLLGGSTTGRLDQVARYVSAGQHDDITPR
jgi:hypothetical protein